MKKKTPAKSGAVSLEIVPAGKSIALKDLSVPQLSEAFGGLGRLEKSYENMSGVCATLRGLVLVEVKEKLGYGKYETWLKKNFAGGKTQAWRYVNLAKAFAKSSPRGTFAALAGDLASSVEVLKEFQLDLAHPVVAQVSAWVGQRSSYQLMLDLGGAQEKWPVRIGQGLRPNTAKEKFDTLEELAAQSVLTMRGCRHCKAWRASTEATLDELIADAEALARDAKKWRLMPKRARHEELMSELAAQYQAELAEEARRKVANVKRKASKQ